MFRFLHLYDVNYIDVQCSNASLFYEYVTFVQGHMTTLLIDQMLNWTFIKIKKEEFLIGCFTSYSVTDQSAYSINQSLSSVRILHFTLHTLHSLGSTPASRPFKGTHNMLMQSH